MHAHYIAPPTSNPGYAPEVGIENTAAAHLMNHNEGIPRQARGKVPHVKVLHLGLGTQNMPKIKNSNRAEDKVSEFRVSSYRLPPCFV